MDFVRTWVSPTILAGVVRLSYSICVGGSTVRYQSREPEGTYWDADRPIVRFLMQCDSWRINRVGGKMEGREGSIWSYRPTGQWVGRDKYVRHGDDRDKNDHTSPDPQFRLLQNPLLSFLPTRREKLLLFYSSISTVPKIKAGEEDRDRERGFWWWWWRRWGSAHWISLSVHSSVERNFKAL